MIDDGAVPDPVLSAPAPAVPHPSLARVAAQGVRAAFLLPLRWNGVAASPVILAVLLIAQLAASIGMSRVYFDTDATFNWRAVSSGWGSTLLVLWACYTLREQPDADAAPARARGAADMFAVYLAQSVFLSLATGAFFAALMHADVDAEKVPQWLRWGVYLLPFAWSTVATLVLLIRSGSRDIGSRVQAVYAVLLGVALSYFAPSASFWSEAEAAQGDAPEPAPLQFDQELVERQAPLLAQRLSALAPQRPGVIDMYTITFAPYEGEEVFRRESRMVSEVMAQRFDAAGRQLQLLNHEDELSSAPWATPLNLRRAIAGLARIMDRSEDVLFIHLTSHGAANGQLAASFWPLDVAPLVPKELKLWLDQAGIRHRVLSVSACYSGSWVAPLAGDDTLVMTAADADNTSYGCGKKSELTFFGRAVFDEQIRTETLSFEQAHAAARKVIATREKEAGKDDGYSNPQIRVGRNIGPYLARLREQLGSN
ncbi:C13 family peptidase [Massilia sp. PAMC28688]|uniref:C13 family peptidase n=1 Tax=Massilia sp. PAMC28688 TaxID=2861283 RepID=UPI001C62FB02|nr:C13 family peptidase [Massilia sp. PAMC28688]QYF93376.1 C13 family peptidase [Massilia sp. PAMC28688]